MQIKLSRHVDGGFVLASPTESPESTYLLEITDQQYDVNGWWNRDLVVLALARYKDGSVVMLHYHPGKMGSMSHCIFEFGDLLARVGLISVLGKASKAPTGITRTTSNTASIAKSAVYSFRDSNHMSSHFMDAKKYPQEGYYVKDELLIRGKIARRHFA